MKQKIKDYLLLLQNDRKTQILTGIVLVMLVAFVFNSPPTRAPQKGPKVTQLGTGGTGTKEAYEDLLNAFSRDLQVTQDQLKKVQQELKDKDKSFSDYDAKTAAIFTKILERMNSGEMGSSGGVSGAYAPIDIDGSSSAIGASGSLAPGSQELEPFGLDQSDPLPPPPPPRNRSAFVAVGDSVRIKLLAGVNAPTDGTPYPVVFKLDDDVLGPDGSRLPLGEARLIAAAQGSLSDSRALFRLTDLSIRLPDGQRRTYKVDGWVVGEDGIRGMRGRLIDYLGKALGAAGAIGAAEGAANALQAAKTTSVISDDGGLSNIATGGTAEFITAGALSGGLGAWGDIIKDRIDQLVPHVEVLSGRGATAIFAKSVVIDGLFEALEDDSTAFGSLD